MHYRLQNHHSRKSPGLLASHAVLQSRLRGKGIRCISSRIAEISSELRDGAQLADIVSLGNLCVDVIVEVRKSF
jgi:hypothetical protein